MNVDTLHKSGNYEELGEKCARSIHTLDIFKQHFNMWFNFSSDEAKYNAIKTFTFAFLKDFDA